GKESFQLTLLLVGIMGQKAEAFVPIFPETEHCTPNSRIVKSCFNIYVERDIEEIMGLIYPGGSKCGPDGRIVTTGRSEHPKTVYTERTTDILGLEQQCKKMRNVYHCLHSELYECDELAPFFFLRHVLFSMEQTINWLCGMAGEGSKSHVNNMHQEVQARFSVLLENVACMECLRVSTTTTAQCYSGKRNLTGDSHIWLKILRLERGPEICSELQKQLLCLWTLPRTGCSDGNDVYKNVTSVFVNTWCDQHPFRTSNSNRKKCQLAVTLAGLLLYFVSN
ncbi:unnamed protein product, partial [Allacma fusca]